MLEHRFSLPGISLSTPCALLARCRRAVTRCHALSRAVRALYGGDPPGLPPENLLLRKDFFGARTDATVASPHPKTYCSGRIFSGYGGRGGGPYWNRGAPVWAPWRAGSILTGSEPVPIGSRSPGRPAWAWSGPRPYWNRGARFPVRSASCGVHFSDSVFCPETFLSFFRVCF